MTPTPTTGHRALLLAAQGLAILVCLLIAWYGVQWLDGLPRR